MPYDPNDRPVYPSPLGVYSPMGSGNIQPMGYGGVPPDTPSKRAAKNAALKMVSGEGGASLVNRGYPTPEHYQAGGYDASEQAKVQPNTQSPGFDAPAVSAADEIATKNWNTMVQQMGASGTPGAAAAMSQPLPGWTKEAGMAVMNQTGGAPRRLNVGYGSEIVASGSAPQTANMQGPVGRANTFTGVGTGAAPAGAAGVFGTPPGGNPSRIEIMHGQLADLNARHKMYSESGTMRGRLRAVALSKQAARLSGQIYSEQTAQHAMGMLNLDTQKAYPDIAMGMGALNRINEDDASGAYAVQAVRHGQNPNAPHNMPGAMYSFSTDASGKPTRRYNNLTGVSDEADERGNFKALTALPGHR